MRRSFSIRNNTLRTTRQGMPVPWIDGFVLQPLAVLNGTADSTNSAANAVASSWTQIFAASATSSTDTIAAIWLHVSSTANAGSADNSCLIDVAQGNSGSEVIVAQDIAIGGTVNNNPRPVLLPVRVPGNTRISFRARSATSGRTIRMSTNGFSSAALLSSPFADRLPIATATATAVDVLGTSQSTSSGTACSSSSAWTLITSSTTKDYQAVILIPSGPGNGTAVTAAQGKLDLGVGLLGSEVQIASVSVQLSATNGLQVPHVASGFGIARAVPAGSRLVIRNNLASTPEALCGCVIGVPYV